MPKRMAQSVTNSYKNQVPNKSEHMQRIDEQGSCWKLNIVPSGMRGAHFFLQNRRFCIRCATHMSCLSTICLNPNPQITKHFYKTSLLKSTENWKRG